LEPTEYRAMNPDGKAILKAAEYVKPHEVPSDDFPFVLITGRTLYQFHTRTKTGRAPQLRDAAPEPWVEMSAADAKQHGVVEGDIVEVATPRRSVVVPCRISGIRDGAVFVPFHYGYWDVDDPDHHRAANEMTLTDWDPVSKQPIFKTAAAQVKRLREGTSPAPAPTTTGSAPVTGDVAPTAGGQPAEAVEAMDGSERR
jgi:anaerobic selenocysteine-containing dehydrogenase